MYLLGEVVGALVFGRLADRFGRRKLFIATIAVYLIFNGLSGFAFNFWSFIILRFIAGSGIGGEYAAVNSAIDELVPARYRGRVDIAVNGTYWAGAAIGAAVRHARAAQDDRRHVRVVGADPGGHRIPVLDRR